MCTVPTFLCYYYWELRKLKTTLSKSMLGNNKQAQLSTGCILVSNPTLLNNNNDNNNEQLKKLLLSYFPNGNFLLNSLCKESLST